MLSELASMSAEDPGSKALVFSSWGRLLRLVQDALAANGEGSGGGWVTVWGRWKVVVVVGVALTPLRLVRDTLSARTVLRVGGRGTDGACRCPGPTTPHRSERRQC